MNQAFAAAAIDHQRAARACSLAYEESTKRKAFYDDAPAAVLRRAADEACNKADGGRVLVMAANEGAIAAYAVAADIHERIYHTYRQAAK